MTKNAAPAPRKPRTTDPAKRLEMCSNAIERYEALAADRKKLLAKAEKLADSRRKSLETTENKLNALYAKRERIISLKDRREGKVPRKTPVSKEEKAQINAIQRMMSEKGLTIKDLETLIEKK